MARAVLLFVISATAAIAAIPIQFESITCIGNELYCSNLSCSVEVVRRKMQVLNFGCTLTEEMDNLIMKFTLYKRMGATYKKFVIDSTEDLCKVLDKTERSNVISRLMPMWKNYGEFPERCPIKLAAIPIHFESITCIGNELYCRNMSCSVEVVRRKLQVLNFGYTLTEEMDNLIIKFTLYKRTGATYKKFFIESTEDLCKVLDKTERSNVISRLLPMWKNYGEFPERCPIKGNISVRRYPMDFSFYPSFFPRGDFKVVLQMIEANKNTSVFNLTIAFNVKYT